MKKKALAALLALTLSLSALAGCAPSGNAPSTVPSATPSAGKAQVYHTEAQGNNGPVKVDVTIDGETITAITVVEHGETAGISDDAINVLPGDIVTAQSVAVDDVAGATVTSTAVKKCVADALAQAGLDAAKYGVTTPGELKQGETQSADVVIVGAGLAGSMAAMELKTSHPELKVVLLEQQGTAGGSLPFTGGAILATESAEHKALGYTCTTDDIVSYLSDSSHSDALNANLTTAIYALSSETMDNLVAAGFPSDEGMKLSSPHNDKIYADWSVGRGKGFQEFFTGYLDKAALDLRLNSKVTGLVVTDGAVTGVTVEDKENAYQIDARAVLLATGGFGNNPELMAQYSPAQGKGLMTVNAGANGDGILFTQQFGTPVTGDGTMGTLKTEDNQDPIASTFIVGADGRRFLNESMASYRVQRAYVEAGKDVAFYIAAGSNEAREAAVTSGAATKYDTLEALAEAMGIDAQSLTQEAEAYTAAAAKGTSPGFDLSADKAADLSAGPYYVSKVICRSFGTLAGIQVLDSTQVADGQGKGVPGLYAAGELMVSNSFTYQYPGAGFGISFAANSGRYAAQQLAETLK